MDQFIQQLVNGLSLGAIYALIAVGYTMVYGILRLINFAHGEVFMVGAMASFYAATRWFKAPVDSAEMGVWHSLLIGAAALAGIAFVRFIVGRRGGRLSYQGEGAELGKSAWWILFAMLVAGITFAMDRWVTGAFFADLPRWGSLIFAILAALIPAMVGAYVAGSVLTRPRAFTAVLISALMIAVAYSARRWFRPGDHSWIGFGALLVVAMSVSAVVGMLIEFLAYRPLRDQPRINSLITAIGVSLFLQYAGQKIFFGPDPKTLPGTSIPVILPGTDQAPETLLPWDSRTVLRFGSPASAAPEPSKYGVELRGSKVRVWWTVAEDHSRTSSPGSDSGPSTRPDSGPTATRPATAPSTLPATVPSDRNASAVVGHAAGKVVSVGINAMLLLILAMTIVLMIVLRFLVLHTRTGLGMRAVSHRFDTAALMGVDINRAVSFTFILGSALAGAAGFLYAGAYSGIDPLMGLPLGLAAFVAAVVGGIGNIPGAVVGGFLLGIAESLVAAYLPEGSRYKTAIVYVILILVLMVRPAGLFGRSAPEKV